MKSIKKLYKKYSGNRITRMIYKLSYIKKKIKGKITQKEKKYLNEKFEKLNKLHKFSKILYTIRLIIFIMLYISVLSTILGNIFLLEEAVSIISIVSGVIGSFVLVLMLAITQKLITVTVSDAHLIADSIIALEVKYL